MFIYGGKRQYIIIINITIMKCRVYYTRRENEKRTIKATKRNSQK
jgi:hypothetical protein